MTDAGSFLLEYWKPEKSMRPSNRKSQKRVGSGFVLLLKSLRNKASPYAGLRRITLWRF
uniref:Uncharacterized protein n=1 Tax=Rhizophora mucronata TaxID=61149 RepID=A0A2P2KUJ7_RHIMU